MFFTVATKDRQLHNLSRFLKMLLTPLVGALFLEQRKMARNGDDAPALRSATCFTKNKKLTSELDDPQISEMLIFRLF